MLAGSVQGIDILFIDGEGRNAFLPAPFLPLPSSSSVTVPTVTPFLLPPPEAHMISFRSTHKKGHDE